MVDINVGEDGNLLSKVHDKIALIDADTLVFQACVTTEEEVPILPREFYTDIEWEEIISDVSYIEGAEHLRTSNEKLIIEKVQSKILGILECTGCIDYELHFTKGRNNFRYLINKEYKANRVGKPTPLYNSETKDTLLNMYPDKVEIHTDIEADDAVVCKYDPTKYILCAVDKDVLYSLKGKHWNYYSSSIYNISAKWLEVDELTAIKHPYKQTLMGDKTDNIIGLRGIGTKTADKILANCTTQEECYTTTLDMYISKGKTEQDMWFVFDQVNMFSITMVDGKYILNNLLGRYEDVISRNMD